MPGKQLRVLLPLKVPCVIGEMWDSRLALVTNTVRLANPQLFIVIRGRLFLKYANTWGRACVEQVKDTFH